MIVDLVVMATVPTAAAPMAAMPATPMPAMRLVVDELADINED